ncbi:MAG: Restriction of telomere capping protein 5 [Chrysothrix sp. TS-e1954]|nr:MAG: Restriction of telomere capping protein 5 [Chrysothrix sp. TS-e1954]
MGQEQSAEPREVNLEQLSQELALKFASKCYTQLELYCFKHVFKSLADEESGLRYWSESSLCRFLQIPDAIEAGHVVNQMATFLGAFPFASQAPCILTMEALLKVITLMTKRYTRILKKGDKDRVRLFFSSLSVHDRRASESLASHPNIDAEEKKEDPLAETLKGVSGFAIDEPANDNLDDEEDEDMLAMSALDSLDAIDAIALGEKPNIRHSVIPSDNFNKLIQLLLLVAPLDTQESLSLHADRLNDEKNLKELRECAKAILSSCYVESDPDITYHTFKTVVPNSLPYLFAGLDPLFEHFLFQKDFDLSKRRASLSEAPTSPDAQSPTSPAIAPSPKTPKSPKGGSSSFPPVPIPLLPSGGEILNHATISQLSFFLSPTTVFRRLHSLFSGSEHGFSLNSIEKYVFNWKAPTILLVSGTIMPSNPTGSRERSFTATFPQSRHPPSAKPSAKVTYGAYIPTAWRATHKTPLQAPEMVLFQLAPTHDVFHASTVSTSHFTLTTAPHSSHPGIAFGSPLPVPGTHDVQPGAVSLHLDDALEFGVFTHLAGGGGSFHSSVAPGRRKLDWQDRFEVEALEIYGVGGEGEEREQRRRVEFEEREAKVRREGRASISGGAGYEQDREILKMAGLLHGESGGSMG